MLINSAVSATSNLKIAFPKKDLQLDPQKIEDMYSMMVVNQLYAKLFRYTPDGQVRPDLVESWTVSKDKRTYTFRIKKAKFSDGSDLTTTHVANSIKRIFVVQAALSSDLAFIKGVALFKKSKNPDDLMIIAEKSHMLKIVTEKPTGLLLYLLSVPDLVGYSN
jgi:ABC-type oligopeptide transport system substrate-binding subunit